MITFAIYLITFKTKITRTYICKTRCTYICKTQTTYTEKQHFTEKLEDNLENDLQRHHVDTQKKKHQKSQHSTVEGHCLSTSEVLKKLKQDGEAKKSKQLKKRKIGFTEASDETQQVQHSKKLRQNKDIKLCKKCRKKH